MKMGTLTLLALCLGLAAPLAPRAAADEWEENTPLYEDDAWYDVSEWFDGNDYNPTDEAIGRWDNETYDASEDVGTDQDNDIDWTSSDYGFFDGADSNDDWYYDYYADDYSNWVDSNNDGYYEYSTQYYDTDNDGVYDSYASFYDTDGDGVYEDSSYYYFTMADNDASQKTKEQARQQTKSRQSQRVELQGKIAQVKSTDSMVGKNVVVRLQGDGKEQAIAIDLGPADAMKQMPKVGDQITVQGPKISVGEQSILLAQSVTMNNSEMNIDRSRRTFTGEVVSTKTGEVLGKTHVFGKLRTDDGKQLLVDMGKEENLDQEFREGANVTVRGPAVKVKDRPLLIASAITLND